MTRVLRVWFQPPSQLSQCSFWITPEMTCVMSWIAIHKKQLRRTCCTPGIFFGDVYNCEMPISSLWRHELRLKFYTFLTRAPLFPSTQPLLTMTCLSSPFFSDLFQRDVKSGKVYYCGAERLSQLYPVMLTKKYKPAMKAELMEGERVQ